jgi:hypothetical protein
MSSENSPFKFVENIAAYQPANSLVARVPRAARGKQKLLGVLAQQLSFPNYFGWNWDALEECLRDLSWLSEVKQISIVHEAVPLSPRGEQLKTYLQILAVAIRRRSETPGPRLEVVFPDELRALILDALNTPPR